MVKSNNFVEDVEQILSVTVMTADETLTPYRVYIGYRAKSAVGIAACNFSYLEGELKISECVSYPAPPGLQDSTSLKIPDT